MKTSGSSRLLGVVLCPKMPFMNEGNRILPPISAPMAKGTPAAETIQPAPPELPPTIRVKSYGLFVVPYREFRLGEQESQVNPTSFILVHSRFEPHASFADIGVTEKYGSCSDHVQNRCCRPGGNVILSCGNSCGIVKSDEFHRFLDGERHAEKGSSFFTPLIGQCSFAYGHGIQHSINFLGFSQRLRESFVDINVQQGLNGSNSIDVNTNHLLTTNLRAERQSPLHEQCYGIYLSLSNTFRENCCRFEQ